MSDALHIICYFRFVGAEETVLSVASMVLSLCIWRKEFFQKTKLAVITVMQ